MRVRIRIRISQVRLSNCFSFRPTPHLDFSLLHFTSGVSSSVILNERNMDALISMQVEELRNLDTVTFAIG